ncbi:MAG: U32 family peptidase [Ruminococcus sp.]|nr:U32 family peptidase [Ruminococcus sp.]
MTEILAPCGSPEVLAAALRTGCDAVYLGGESFSARANAANFSAEELEKAVRLCHISGVKVYQAINTVILDSEMDECIAAVKRACALGVDGLITQDLALCGIVREMCPEMEIHASTQMSLHTRRGFLLARELGFTRAVASRELPGDILKELCSLPIECEVFVHGALCMSVSGQCYMSAVIGSRSANRGLCAQACRLPASCVKNDRDSRALSLKDMSHLAHLRELEGFGAASLKIEGRMKRPEYVAAAVNAVRCELEDREYDRSLVEGVFSRSGFTDGYFTGRRGSGMFGFRSREDVDASAEAIPALHELYRREYKRSKVDALACFRLGEPGSLKLTDENGVSAEVWADPPQKAVNRPADEGYVRKQLSKLGDTVYEPGEIVCQLEPGQSGGVSIPASQLNDMRRRAAAELDEKRYEFYTRRPAFAEKELSFAPAPRPDSCGIRISIHTAAQLDGLDISGIELVYADLRTAGELLERGRPAEKLCAVMPRFTFDEEGDFTRLKALAQKGIGHMLCTNLAHISAGRELGMTLHGGFGLNVTNTLALRELKSLGLADCTASFELRASEMSALGGELPFGAIGYGRLPMMLTVNCPIRAQRGCKGCTGELFDRTGRCMPVKCSKEQGYTEILNSDVLCVSDRQRDFPAVSFWELDFYGEDAAQIGRVTEAFERGTLPDCGSITRGLYYRGIR